MNELARWSLKVSRETDIALRTLLATRGGRKGDLSRFVEEAVNRAVLREPVCDVRERNADADQGEIERIVEAELGAVGRKFWAEHRDCLPVRGILDTNVLLSGLISSAGIPAGLIDGWLDERFCTIRTDRKSVGWGTRRSGRVDRGVGRTITNN